jgi:hypothetical protein
MAKKADPSSSTDFPPGIPKPALRALASAGISRLGDATRFSESELLALHGMGPKAMGIIKAALRAQGTSFAVENASIERTWAAAPRRLGFLRGDLSVPDDFDRMADAEIAALCETGE